MEAGYVPCHAEEVSCVLFLVPNKIGWHQKSEGTFRAEKVCLVTSSFKVIMAFLSSQDLDNRQKQHAVQCLPKQN